MGALAGPGLHETDGQLLTGFWWKITRHMTQPFWFRSRCVSQLHRWPPRKRRVTDHDAAPCSISGRQSSRLKSHSSIEHHSRKATVSSNLYSLCCRPSRGEKRSSGTDGIMVSERCKATRSRYKYMLNGNAGRGCVLFCMCAPGCLGSRGSVKAAT